MFVVYAVWSSAFDIEIAFDMWGCLRHAMSGDHVVCGANHSSDGGSGLVFVTLFSSCDGDLEEALVG